MHIIILIYMYQFSVDDNTNNIQICYTFSTKVYLNSEECFLQISGNKLKK